MKTITWKEIETIAEKGDALKGNFRFPQWDLIDGEWEKKLVETKTLTFTSCISCLTSKEDVRSQATHFVHLGELYEIAETLSIKEKLDKLKHAEEEIIACFDLEDFYNKKLLKLEEKKLVETKEYQSLLKRKENLKTEEKIRNCCDLEDEFLSVFEKLDEPYRTIVLLRYLRGLTYKEIGTRMGKEEGTIRNLSVKARELIEDELLSF